MGPAELVALTGAGALVTGSGIGWLTTRRTSSGKIATSDAATLWAASEKIRTDQAIQLDKVTEQRDRLLGAGTDIVIPLLTASNESLAAITDSLAANTDALARVTAALARLEQQHGP